MRALEKDPAQRFPDADAFIAALRGRARRRRPPARASRTASSAAVRSRRPGRRRCRLRRAGRRSAAAASRREGAALVAVAARRCSSPPSASSPPCCCCRGTQKVAVPTWSAPTRPTPRPRCAATASRSTRALQTAEQPAGQVIGQDPTGGTKADKGSTVTLTVSDGPAAGGGPAGRRADRLLGARAAARRPGFKAVRARARTPTRVAEGPRDLGQPAEGQTVDKGSTVTLVVSSGKPAGRRSPTSSARASTRRPSTAAGGRASRSRAPTRSPTRTRAPCSAQNPERRDARPTRARPSRSRSPRRPRRSPCPT